MKKNILFVLFILFSFHPKIWSQTSNQVETTTKTIDIKLFGNLFHQHHDFFHKAFSFQGAEMGVMIDRSLLFGIYSSAFASNLNVEIENKSQFVWIAQSGLSIGKIWNERKWIHPGCQLNAGYFWLKSRDNDFPFLDNHSINNDMNGLVISPQIFGEFNVCKWLKIRTGLSYNLYSFSNHSVVKPTDLQNMSFTFGMVFGKFKK